MKLTLSPDLLLPLDAVTQTFAILAMRGVGKTHTASVFAEELSEAGLPFVVLDPTGAWWGLRASADGKKDGYPVTILGGDRGDVPLEEGAGKIIADLVAEKAPSLVLDLSLLSKGAMRRFVADFAERLYEKNRRPLHLIIDEADAFAPQKPRPDEMRMLGALDEIVRRGRIRGLGCTLVTQRSAVLNKDVLTQTEALVVLRTAHPRDRAPVLEWMEVHATPEQLSAVEESLASLPKGDAWVMSAGWLDLFARVHIRERRTYNSSATPTPGQVRAAPRRLAPVDLEQLGAAMKEAAERAKANDPAALRRRVAELERELARTAAAAAPKTVEVPLVPAAEVKRLERISERFLKMGEEIQGARNILTAAILSAKPPPRPHAPAQAAPPPRNGVPPPPRPVTGADDEIPPVALRMLENVARFHPATVSRRQLATLSGYSAKSSSFRNVFSVLNARGLVVKLGDRVALSRAGEAVFSGGLPPPMSPAEVQALWRERLEPVAWRMLEVVLREERIERAALAEACSYSPTSSSFRNVFSVLNANELVDKVGSLVVPAESLLEGSQCLSA